MILKGINHIQKFVVFRHALNFLSWFGLASFFVVSSEVFYATFAHSDSFFVAHAGYTIGAFGVWGATCLLATEILSRLK